MVPRDHDLHSAIVDLTLPAARFGHREHLRLAWIALTEHADFAEAAGRFRRALRRYVVHAGAAHKYHETITWAYLALIREAMLGRSDADSEAFLAANPDLLDHRNGALARRYDLAALMADPVAREVFVLPPEAPLKTVERVQTGVRLEKRLLNVLKGLAAVHDLSLGDLLEGIVLHAFEGRSPFGAESQRKIAALREVYGLTLEAADSHKLVEKGTPRKRAR